MKNTMQKIKFVVLACHLVMMICSPLGQDYKDELSAHYVEITRRENAARWLDERERRQLAASL